MADHTPPPNPPVSPAPVTHVAVVQSWQQQYGPLIAAVAFAVLSAVLRWAGIDAPPPPQPVALMVAPELGPARVTVAPAE